MLTHTEPVEGRIATHWKKHINKKDAARIEPPQLFNLKDDISESQNVAAAHPEVLAQIMQLAEKARNDVGDFDRFGENARSFGAEKRTLVER